MVLRQLRVLKQEKLLISPRSIGLDGHCARERPTSESTTFLLRSVPVSRSPARKKGSPGALGRRQGLITSGEDDFHPLATVPAKGLLWPHFQHFRSHLVLQGFSLRSLTRRRRMRLLAPKRDFLLSEVSERLVERPHCAMERGGGESDSRMNVARSTRLPSFGEMRAKKERGKKETTPDANSDGWPATRHARFITSNESESVVVSLLPQAGDCGWWAWAE